MFETLGENYNSYSEYYNQNDPEYEQLDRKNIETDTEGDKAADCRSISCITKSRSSLSASREKGKT